MKSVQLNDDEINEVIKYYGRQITSHGGSVPEYVERIRYLTKRLNDKKIEALVIEEKKEWQ